jgi:hypothetical protein
VEDELVPIPVYAAMLVATLAGQFLGVGLQILVFGRHALWAPFACSLLLEAAVGAQYGAARAGRALTMRERGRISGTYTLALCVLSLPIAVWLSASGHLPMPHVSTSTQQIAIATAVAVALALVYTALRFFFMGLFARRSR